MGVSFTEIGTGILTLTTLLLLKVGLVIAMLQTRKCTNPKPCKEPSN